MECSIFIIPALIVFFLKLLMLLAFKWSHKFKIVKGKVPTSVNWIQQGVFFVSKPLVTRHIAHFTESVNQALLKLRYPSFYPPFTDLYIPSFEQSDFEWSKTYLKILLSLFPNDLRPALHLANSIRLNGLTCFRSAVRLEVLLYFRSF